MVEEAGTGLFKNRIDKTFVQPQALGGRAGGRVLGAHAVQIKSSMMWKETNLCWLVAGVFN